MMGHLSKTPLVQLGSRWWRRETITCIYSAFLFTASRPDYTGWVGVGGGVIPQEYNPPGTQSQAVGQAINLVN